MASSATPPVRPGPAPDQGVSQSQSSGTGARYRKRRSNRGGKKNRRKSFAVMPSGGGDDDDVAADPLDDLADAAQTVSSASRNDYFEGGGGGGGGGSGSGLRGRRTHSSTSIESESLLDHRDQQPFLRARRPSVASPVVNTSVGAFAFAHPSPTRLRVTKATGLGDSGDDDSATSPGQYRPTTAPAKDDDDDGRASSGDEGAPLLSRSLHNHQPSTPFRANSDVVTAYGSYGGVSSSNNRNSDGRRSPSRRGSVHSSAHQRFLTPFGSGSAPAERYNVNYPPSVPGSPALRPSDPLNRNMNFGDEMLRDELSAGQRHDLDLADDRRRSPSPPLRRSNTSASIRNLGHSYNDAAGGPRRRDGSFDTASGTGGGGGGGGSSIGHGGSATSLLGAAQDDVCFPQEALLSEIAEEDHEARQREDGRGRGGGGQGGGHDGDGDGDPSSYRVRPVRRRRGKWPDLAILEDWRQLEKEARGWQGRRAAKKIKEPQLINGRLRPVNKGWHRAEEDAPYRFTYFNELFQSTIHSATISELVQPGEAGGESDLTFRDLFIPDPPLLSDSEDDEDEDEVVDEEGAEAAALTDEVVVPMDAAAAGIYGVHGLHNAASRSGGTTSPDRDPLRPQVSRLPSMSAILMERTPTQASQVSQTVAPTPLLSPRRARSPAAASMRTTLSQVPPLVPLPTRDSKKPNKQPQYGERPVWWLDMLSPTEAEMKVLSKAFGIHPLTAEDIMMQEAREKVELFQHYYFVSYRSFDQDPQSDTFLEPVNMYVVVFREGVLSFHFSMTPHPANVRRRIRQLSDYMILSSDWISYAIIDDITDVFVPLIQNIEDEVDDIDDAILAMHSQDGDRGEKEKEREKDGGDEHDSNMLRRVGDCRKRVMSLYRLLGNKADVIKGFAKRCNEYWEVAPRSEIGLYLGDIQDHIVTMTANLSHYEKILSRSHGNYLAQINIRMNERQEQTADVLGKLTVLGTIVLPMNIITGLWGMNVWVPGQAVEGDLGWFAAITAGLLFFGMACYLIAKRVYNIV